MFHSATDPFAFVASRVESMATPLWTPSEARITQSNLAAFGSFLSQQFQVPSQLTYSDLHAWSLKQPELFWQGIWKFCNIQGEQGERVLLGNSRMFDARWFPDGNLNFAANLLHPKDTSIDSHLALVATNEKGDVVRWSFAELRSKVTALALFLKSQGIERGDRVAGLLPNVPAAVVAMLATTSIGAIWSCCSPDFGTDAVVDRFCQIEPKLLFSQTTCQYNGKKLLLENKVSEIASRLPSVKGIVLCDSPANDSVSIESAASFRLDDSIKPFLGKPFEFEAFPFSHPIYILYSSGTTGVPKCIVHSAGGTLLQHAKELHLHTDLHPGDTLYYYTTTGWMMWNWLVSGLQAKATILLYDGGPLFPNGNALFELASKFDVTHFGASAKFFSAVQKEGCVPREMFELPKLRTILSTGSPLLSESYDYIYENIKEDVHLASISGGTDIVSCFVLGVPTESVYRGQIQGPGLGMDMQVYDEHGKPIHDGCGELVCAAPFPSMPIGFWNDPEGAQYHKSYFEQFENVWCHGDWAQRTPEGGFIIFGRSDATLNPGGVRIGTAEIYRQVESFDSVAECLATALRKDGDEQIILFVKMKPDHCLQPSLVDMIKKRLREHCSPRHVPTYIIEASDLPRTISGKLSEIAVRNAIHGLPIKNEAALANPESLDFFRGIPLNYRLQKEV